MTNDPKYLDLRFLSETVRKQIEDSKNILEEVKRLRETANKITDQEIKNQIQESVVRLLNTAGSMTSNVVVTQSSTTASLAPGRFQVLVPPLKKENAD
jgi:hypothetical protein